MFMNPVLAINHLLNFMAPALAMALMMACAVYVFWRNRAKSIGWLKLFAIDFVICLAILLAGLIIFGNDGKMWTYTALVVISATSQWLILRGWRD